MTTTTATPADAIIAETTIESYRTMDAKAKGKARSALNKAMLAFIAASDGESAKKVLDHLNSLTSANVPTKADVPVETVVAVRIATLRAAADLLESGQIVPNGIDSVDGDKLVAALEAVEIDPDAAKVIASAKLTRSAPSNDIAQIILDALESAPEGAMLAISTIANTKPGVSDGAVAARLFDKNGPKKLTGALVGRVVAIEADGTHPRRVRLA